MMTKFWQTIHATLREKASLGWYAAALYGLMALAYLPFVGGMGYNYDDWEGVYLFTKGMSRAEVWNYFLIDRPFSSLIHWAFYPLLGTSVEAWHWLVMSLHWGAIVFLVATGLKLFPKRVTPIAWSGLLLAVFPGITRQFVAFTTAPHYVSMFFFSFSLWAMVSAIQMGNSGGWKIRLLWSLSWLAALFQVFIIEYFALMEAARLLVMLGMGSHGEAGKTIRQRVVWALTRWAPYGLLLGFFLIFKFMLLPNWALAGGTVTKHQISLFEEFGGAPVNTVAALINLILQDGTFQLLSVWLLPLSAKDLDVSSKSYLVSWVAGLLGAGLAAAGVLAWQVKQGLGSAPTKKQALWLAVTLAAVMLLGGLPAWIIGRQGTVGLWSSRFFLAQVLGSVPLLVLVAMMFLGWNRPVAANLFFALLFAGGLAYQFREGNRYTLYWDAQEDYYWQLKTRAPGLVEGAFIASPYTPFARTSDYQIGYAIDLLYHAGDSSTQTKVWWFDAPDDLKNKETGEYKDKPVSGGMRNIAFDSGMGKALPVFYQPSRGCLQVISDGYYLGEPLLSAEEEALFDLAHKDLILEAGNPAPEAVFGVEPTPDWCTYYQQAEKFRSEGDWEAIYHLWVNTLAEDDSLRPKYGPEYLPFIESFANAGDWERASNWSVKAGKLTREAKPFLCAAWQERFLSLDGGDEQEAGWELVKTELDCGG